jgi:excinuclease ABC subunit B
MAEDLTEYLNGLGVPSRYLHSDIDTLERMAIIRALRRKEFDVLVGINLLREGLDIPEVSLVAVLDADKEGFLRSRGSLIQTFGRAARNVSGKVILYADRLTGSMIEAMEETNRRREKQLKFNLEHNITPASIVKDLETPFDNLFSVHEGDGLNNKKGGSKSKFQAADNLMLNPEFKASPKELGKLIQSLEREMREAARALEFEQAASIRDRITFLRQQLVLSGSGAVF